MDCRSRMINRIANPIRSIATAALLLGVVAVPSLHAQPSGVGSSDEEVYQRSPKLKAPKNAHGARVYQQAAQATGKRILVSIEDRWMWLITGRDTLLSVPVAVGMNNDFTYAGKKFRFETPRGKHKVLRKEENPIWTPPNWHYYEKSVNQGLTPVDLVDGDVHVLSDGTSIEVRDGVVGKTNEFGNWWPWTPGMELVFDDKIFIPPLRSPQRRVPNALGPRKLDLGDGYLIHGTHLFNTESIGQAVSHGCVRMPNDYLVLLYDLVPVGTPVYIF